MMKQTLFVVFILLLINCSLNTTKSHNHNNQKTDSILGTKLIEKNFLKYADSLKIDSLKNGIIKTFNIYDNDIHKVVHIDAEELSEFNFDFFMPELNKILSKRNIQLKIEKAIDYNVSNVVYINGQKVKLYTKKDLETGIFWDVAPRKFFKHVNGILQEHHLEERCYLLYSGNDLQVILLTEKQCEIISKKYESQKKNIPYLP